MPGRRAIPFLLILLTLAAAAAVPAPASAQEKRRVAALGIEVRQGRRPAADVEVRLEAEGPLRVPSPPPSVTGEDGRAEVWWLSPGIWRLDLLVDGEVAYFLTVRLEPGRRAEEMGAPARDADAPDLRWKFFRPQGPPPPPPAPPAPEMTETPPSGEPVAMPKAEAEPAMAAESGEMRAPAGETTSGEPTPGDEMASDEMSGEEESGAQRTGEEMPAEATSDEEMAGEAAGREMGEPDGGGEMAPPEMPAPEMASPPAAQTPQAEPSTPQPSTTAAPAPEAPADEMTPPEAPSAPPEMPAPAAEPEPQPQPSEPPPPMQAAAGGSAAATGAEEAPEEGEGETAAPPVAEPPVAEVEPAEQPLPEAPLPPGEVPSEETPAADEAGAAGEIPGERPAPMPQPPEPPQVEKPQAAPSEAPGEAMPSEPAPSAEPEPPVGGAPPPQPMRPKELAPVPFSDEAPLPSELPEEGGTETPATTTAPMPEGQAAPAEPRVPAPPAAAFEPPRFAVRSGAEGDCPDCKKSEVALTVERTVPSAADVSGCGSNMRAAALRAAGRLAGRGAGLGPGMPLDGSEVSAFVGDEAACQLVGVVLPPGVRYRGFTFAARDGAGDGGPCQPGKPCPVATATWPDRPVIETLADGSTLVYGAFANASGAPLRASLTVYYIPRP